MTQEFAYAVVDDSPAVTGRTVLSTLVSAVWLAILLGLVCSGVAIGTVASRHRAALMGFLGLVTASVAWAAAKGVLVGRLLRTPSSTFSRRALTGLTIGLVFGSAILWLNDGHAVATIRVNQLLLPAGCAIVIHFVARFADRHSALERLAAGGG